MDRSFAFLLFLLVILALCTPGAQAFGAGNIPSFAYMEGKAFRHGDIEDTLAGLAKGAAGGGFAIGSLLGKSKFGGLDIKRVYFGNWLRDYSQAVDVASLKKVPLQTVINLCMVMGFLAHGYATHEFEVTIDRLGVYLPTEHIDNPKGYGDGEDARKYDPRLRGPVDPRELEIDPATGMKNYIANETGGWDTSKTLVRKTLEKCIHIGRQHKSSGQKADLYESYRLLGQLLHTLEDYPAHSNFCELALVAEGHTGVFVHVGDHVRVRAKNGRMVAPIITGSFGSSDFIHSLLGEATDHLSEASVSDLNKQFDKSRSRDRSSPASSNLREMFFSLPGGSGNEMSRDMEGIERIRAGETTGGKRPEDLSPQELHAVLWQVLSFRDSIVKKIEKTIEKIPGLGPLIEKLMDAISVFIYTTLEPYIKPLLKTATTGLSSASAEVIDTHDQYEVFNDPSASDATHSFLSKDHFNLILNEPAGNLAKIIVTHTVNLVTRAWGDTSIDVNKTTEDILECLFHPDFHNTNSKVQREMLQYMRTWVQSLGHNQYEIIRRLGKEAVRNHQNIRMGGEGHHTAAESSAAHGYGVEAQHKVSSTVQGYFNQVPGVSQAQGYYNQFQNFTGSHGMRDMPAPGAPGSPPAMPGQASSFYAGGQSPPPSTASQFAPPSGPPAFPGSGQSSGYFPGGQSPPPPSSYAPPSGPPAMFPEAGQPSQFFPSSGGQYPPPPSSGTPYSPPDGPPSVEFPGSGYAPSLSASGGGPTQYGGYPSPGGPPPFPGAPSPYGAPPGPPPGQYQPPNQGSYNPGYRY